MIAKIEKVEAYENLDEIIAVTDGVMVARGDYGVEAGVARVPLMQKDTIARATQAGKLVITATQMLESMIHSPEPTRAEADRRRQRGDRRQLGRDALGRDERRRLPGRGGARDGRDRRAAEEVPEIHGRARDVTPDTAGAAVMHAAVELAHELDAAALIVPTATGGAPARVREVPRRRPDHRRRPRPPRRRPAHARVGRLSDA